MFMLIVSAGMQKSGSGYFYNLINEIIVQSGSGPDARKLKHDRNLESLMKWHNNNIGHMTFSNLFKLWRMSRKEGPFVVKTHSGPTPAARMLSKCGLIRIVYSYRDPRDATLSAIDAGKKILARGEHHSFAKMVDFEVAVEKVRSWIIGWKRYADMNEVLTVKYEEMMLYPVDTAKKIENFLKMPLDSKTRNDALWKFSKDNPISDRRGMHFNKAKVSRYKTEMHHAQKEKCKIAFGEYLEPMGYDLE
jgi:hypothetical protein